MTAKVQATGERSLRFEASGPTTSDLLGWLRENPPAMLAGQPVGSVAPVGDNRLELTLERGRLTVEADTSGHAVSLMAESWTDESVAATHASELVDALGSYVADPERLAARAGRQAGVRVPDPSSRAQELFSLAPISISRPDALRLVVAAIDLTTLAGDDTNGRVRALCAQARQPDATDPTVGPTAAVCVYPNLVAVARELTAGSSVAVASVAGAFPSGLSSLEVKLSDIAEAVCAGADEIDVVLNRAAFLAGHDEIVIEELHSMREQIGPRAMKVILETSELGDAAAIGTATRLAIQAKADWVKTSTGKSARGATPEAVFTMAQSIAEARDEFGPVGLKISGGVRTAADALGYLAIIENVLGPDWLTPERVRFGASGLLSAVVAELHTS